MVAMQRAEPTGVPCCADFNARARAENFTPEELPQVMDYLHEVGVKGYVTLNILVSDVSSQEAVEESEKG